MFTSFLHSDVLGTPRTIFFTFLSGVFQVFCNAKSLVADFLFWTALLNLKRLEGRFKTDTVHCRFSCVWKQFGHKSIYDYRDIKQKLVKAETWGRVNKYLVLYTSTHMPFSSCYLNYTFLLYLVLLNLIG